MYMPKAPLALPACALAFCLSATVAQSATISDNFDTAHDYLSGTAGTIWDGLHNAANASTADATTTNAGKMTLITNGTTTAWNSSGNTGPLLYRNVTDDFVAQVTVSGGAAANYNVAALIARDAAGTTTSDEDYVAVNYNFFGATPGVQTRNYNDGSQSDTSLIATGTPVVLQLERSGNDLIASYSTDNGATFTGLATYNRFDLPSTLQIGLAAANYGNNSYDVQFDDFSLTTPEIPEPATIGLMCLGALVMSCRQKRRSH